MGRKEDEEDQGKVSKDTNGSCIEELTKKCKPLNVQLSRLELPKNGIVLIKDDSSDQLKELHLNQNEGEFSDSNVNNADKVGNEDSSNDTAETIKKIKEFIASGRCEESRKEQDSSDKKVGYKSKVVAKRKLLHKKDVKTYKKSSTNLDRLNVERELERTLKGNESGSQVNDPSSNLSTEAMAEKNKFVESKSDSVDDLKSTENADNSFKNHDLLTTPSRVSKRIQSKSVKFSVKKMLRGDDVNVLKRMIPGYQDNTPTKKERLSEKKVKVETKKISTPVKSPASPLPLPSPSPQPEPSQENEPQTTPSLPEVPSSSTEINEQVSTPAVTIPSPPETPQTSLEMLVENKEKLAALSDKIGKFAIGNGKITVELKGSQQKKVVRIALPPVQSQSSLPNTSLGPDIIIKRVKPVKKTVVMPEDPSVGMKGIIEKEVFLDSTPVSNTLKDVKMLPRVNLERITPPKLKENLVKMHKNILRHGRSDKTNSKEFKVKDKSEINATSDISGMEAESMEELPSRLEKESVRVSEVRPIVYHKDNLTSGNISSEKVSEGGKGSLSESNKKLENSSRVQDESKKQSSLEKTKSRKTAKVTPLTQVKTKNDGLLKKSFNKIKKLDTDPEKNPTADEFEPLEPEKETYNSLFDRYFSTRERYVQHHDSLDSDSSEDFNDEVYAHFINLRKRKEAASEEEKKEDTITMYDLMHDISIERPTWNIHVTSDGQAFCLAQVDLVENVPVMKKVIEIDLEYNAKVFVAGTVMPEFEGNYSSYEDIRQLIYEVDQL